MTDEERYLFDLQGYLVLRGVLAHQEVDELNEISDRVYPRDYSDGNDSKGRRGIRNVRYVSRWDPACQRLIDHPRIVPILAEFLGPKFRIDHDYAMFMNAGSDSGNLHGLPELGTHRYFHYLDGQVRTGLTVVTFMLAPAGAGDGGFVCIPGSHKGNFPQNLPEDVRTQKRVPPYVVQPEVDAGDVVIFTEALTHGTKGWCGNPRTACLSLQIQSGTHGQPSGCLRSGELFRAYATATTDYGCPVGWQSAQCDRFYLNPIGAALK